ncbi:MAG: hypothetical protein R2942_11270 [Ignavibacteria bacterium]
MTSHFAYRTDRQSGISLGEFLEFNFEVTEDDINEGICTGEIKAKLLDISKVKRIVKILMN